MWNRQNTQDEEYWEEERQYWAEQRRERERDYTPYEPQQKKEKNNDKERL